MKKLLKSALALATVFFAASCTQEKLQPVGSNTVSFKVEIPEVATKAAAVGNDASMINDLVYAVYKTTAASVDEALDDWAGTTTFLYAENSVDPRFSDNSTDVVNVELLNDQNHIVLLWAQHADVWVSQHGDAIDLTNITYPSNLEVSASCADKYAAFSGVKFIVANDKTNTEAIELTRPFAQINIATVKPENYAVVINSTDVTVNAAGDKFNVAAQRPTDSKDVTYSWAGKVYEVKLNANSQNYDHYLAMCYVFAAGNVSVDYTIVTAKHGTITNTITNVPVAKNYRTNIIGNLLTSDTNYNVVLDKNWGGENIIATNAEEFVAALDRAQDGDVINIPEGEYEIPSSLFDQAQSGTFTIVGNGEETNLVGASNPNEGAPGVYANGKHLVFKDLTYVTPNRGYNGGFGHAASVTFINCTIIGQFYAQSGAPHYFYDCTIDPLTGYLYTYGSDCVFDGCTFRASEGRALQVYEDAATGENTVTIMDCHFVAAKQAQTWDGKPVTGIDINSNGAVFNVTVENCTTTGFPTGLNSGSDLYNIKDGGLAYTNLVVDGEFVNRAGGYTKHATYPNIWIKDNNYYVFDKAGLADLNAYFAANSMNNVLWSREYHIAADIDAAGYTWDSVFVVVGNNANNGFVLDGNGHTISNLTINGSFFTGTPNGGNAGTTPGYIKDLTIDKATVTGDHWAAVFWGNSYGEIVYENVTVKNTSVTGNCNTAVFLGGTVIEGAGSIDNILFKNCKVENCSVVANGKDGQDPTGASVFCGRAYGKTKLTFEGNNSIDNATTVVNNNGLVGGKVYGYTAWYGSGFEGTGACDTFTNWDGIDFEFVSEGLLKNKNTTKYYVSSAAGLEKMNQMFSDKTAGRDVVLNLIEDIDFTGNTWTPVDSHADSAFEIAEINGNGHTISNLTINGQAMFTRFAGTGDVVVKDITFDNAKVESTGINVSVLTVQSYQNVLLNNVDVKNSSFIGAYKVAPLIGTVYNESPSSITATLKNCDVENCEVTCTSYDFCTTGMVAFVYEGNNDRIEFENCTVKDVKLFATPNGYSSHAAIYVNDAETDDCFNEAEGVTVTNVTFTAL
jgi:hypothetical protein